MSRAALLARALVALVLLGMAVPSASAQPADSLDGRYAVYARDGRPATLGAIAEASRTADVVFLGEIHNDPTAHALQLRLFASAASLARDFAEDRPVALALEMFETDVQPVLDEYLAGLVRERDFLAAARPWGNYATDYRPLVEHAREGGMPVLASNAPKRYVSRVSREGAGALAALPPSALQWLPPLPVAPPSAATAEAFRAVMADMGGHGAMPGMPSVDDMLAAQNLRDASMADVVATYLARTPGALVVHVNGGFHSEAGRGIPEHLARRVPGVRALIVAMRPSEDLATAPADAADHDFVILTDQAFLPTSGE